MSNTTSVPEGNATSVPKGKTYPLTVHDMSFMLDRLGKDCEPLQFLRELTQNSVEAILKTPEKTGEIVWDVDWPTYELDEGVYKLSVTDMGCGMTGQEMMQYINHLSSSRGAQSLQGNYGVGAKLAAGPINPEGMVYLSWVDGAGAMTHFWRDPTDHTYGLKQIELPDGSYDFWARPDEAIKPDLVGDHGTKVILFGKSKNHDTMNAPEGARETTKWIRKYLNSRYFRFPEGIRVRVREGWSEPREDTDLNVLREVTGQKRYLSEHMAECGVVDLTGAKARWWILKDEPALGGNSGFIESSGHIAALYKEELYELKRGRSGTSMLQQFGVIFGMRRTVIYVEPDLEEMQEITTNTARTNLLINSESLPWSDWANEFRERMPEAIVALMEEVSGAKTSDHSESIRARLKKIEELFDLRRYRPTPSGDSLVDPADRMGRGRSKPQGGGAGDGSSGFGAKAERGGTIYSIFLAKDGKPADKSGKNPWPDVDWVSVKDGTRQPGDMEDRAAKYLKDQHRIMINADFRVFRDMTDRWCKRFSSIPGAPPVIEETVREWFEQTLIEAVMGSFGLRGSPEWNPEEVNRAVSEEALTTVVLPRYHTDFAISRELGSKLGSRKAVAS